MKIMAWLLFIDFQSMKFWGFFHCLIFILFSCFPTCVSHNVVVTVFVNALTHNNFSICLFFNLWSANPFRLTIEPHSHFTFLFFLAFTSSLWFLTFIDAFASGVFLYCSAYSLRFWGSLNGICIILLYVSYSFKWFSTLSLIVYFIFRF